MSKKYDFQKAMRLIEANKDQISSASLGMYEDWFWTAEDVFDDGEFVKDLNETKVIGGIPGSSWATPCLRITFLDGRDVCIECFVGESSESAPLSFGLGELSRPVQSRMPKLVKEVMN